LGVTFSVELNSKSHVKHISVSNKSHDRVLFEGSLGELADVSMIEGAVLEVKGTNGILRIDLTQDELTGIITQSKDDEKK
jgi:hypothetical protein